MGDNQDCSKDNGLSEVGYIKKLNQLEKQKLFFSLMMPIKVYLKFGIYQIHLDLIEHSKVYDKKNN